jgi:hypothetical protein
LEKEHKKMMENLGPHMKQMLMKKVMEQVNHKKKIENIILKETHSKANSMTLRIKGLKNELKTLKDNEIQMSSRVSNASKQAENYYEKLRYSPISTINKSATENRSHSVKPQINKSFFSKF